MAEGTLVFNGSTRTINTNDFTAGTQFDLLRFHANAAEFILRGNAVALGGNVNFTANPDSYVLQTIELDLILNGDHAIQTRGDGDILVTGNISDDGNNRTLTKGLPGTLFLRGTNTFTGSLYINRGTVQFSDYAAISSTDGIRLGDAGFNGVLLYDGSSDIEVGQQVWLQNNAGGTGNSVLEVGGAGTMTFTNANFNAPQTGATEDRDFFVRGSGNGAIEGVIRDNNEDAQIRLNKNNEGTWTLLGNNLYTGDTTINEGTLVAGHNNAFGSTGNVILSGSGGEARLDLMDGITIAQPLEFENSNEIKILGLTADATSATYAGTITVLDENSRRARFYAEDGQTLHVTGQIVGDGSEWGIDKMGLDGTLVLHGTNTYMGTTRITQGTIRAMTSSALGTSRIVVSNNGTLELVDNLSLSNDIGTSGPGPTSGKILRLVDGATEATLSGDIELNAESGGITFQAGEGGILTVSGAISTESETGPNDNILKTGAGEVVLRGTNTYGGTTTIEAGTLRIASSGSVAGSEVTVEDGGRFIVDGAYTAGLITVADGATAGGAGTVGDVNFEDGARLLFQPGVALEVADTFTISFGGFGVADLVDIDGNGYTVWRSLVDIGQEYVLINGAGTVDFANVDNVGTANAFDLGDGKEAYFKDGSLELVVIPEPGSGLLLAFAAGGLLFWRRLRQG